MPVLPTIPGHPLIISTWVITLTRGMASATDMVAMAAGFLTESAMDTHRGTIRPATTATIRRGTPHTINTPITPPGDLIAATKNHLSIAMYPLRHPVIPVTGAW